MKKGDYYRAAIDATDAIRLKPDFGLACFYRAEAYCKEGNFDLALASLAEAVRLEPKLARRDPQYRAWYLYVEIYQGQARTHADARQWKEAVDSLLAIDKLKETITFPVIVNVNDRLERQLARAYQDLGSDRLKAQKVGRSDRPPGGRGP